MSSVAGVIFAGGYSGRFGSDKAEALLQGRRLIDHVAKRLEPQVDALAIAGPASIGGFVNLEDGAHAGKGPLAGLLAGLHWATTLPDVTWLVTAPCDVPLLPTNLVDLLSKNRTQQPSVLDVDGRWQAGCALWPVNAQARVEQLLFEGADLSLHTALKQQDAQVVNVNAETLEGSFANINTQGDLAELERELS